MYGFSLTIYLLFGWLMRRYPGADVFSRDARHLWNTLLGWKVNLHFDPAAYFETSHYSLRLHMLSAAWKVRYQAQRMATSR